MDIGERIVKLRERKNWSQRELARRANLNTSVMNRIEQGDRPLRDVELKIFSELFDVTTDFLITGKEKSESSFQNNIEDPDFMYAMRSADGFTEENKKKILDFIEMIEELEKGRKPGDKQPRKR